MKKFQSYDDVEKFLMSEKIPYKDNKEKILEELKTKPNIKFHVSRKALLICAIFAILTFTVAFTFGYITEQEHVDFVKAHNGEILSTLTDENGDVVVQIGVMDNSNFEERKLEEYERMAVAKRFENISQPLEDNLPDDKVALFIPVSGLDSIKDFDVLNDYEIYYTIEDIKNNIKGSIPLPEYTPDGFTFSDSLVFYQYEDYYKQYEDESTHKEFLSQLFEQAKTVGEEYYYKEYTRYKDSESYWLNYSFNENSDISKKFTVMIGKGKMSSLMDNGDREVQIETIEHNGREYLYYDNEYATYVYLNGELWTIRIVKPKELETDDVFKIIESIK